MRHRFRTGLPGVNNSFVPKLAVVCMVSKFLQVVVRRIPCHFLERRRNTCMQRSPSLPEKSAIGDLSGKSMLEGVLDLWKEICLVNKLSGLQCGKVTVENILRESCNGP